jgi:hypothetical protein
MARRKLEVDNIVISGCNERMFIPFFNIDSDFSENEEYFREDTLELGFGSESERCSKELFEKFEKDFYERAYIEVLEEALEEAANYYLEGAEGNTHHIVGNTSYTSSYEIQVICTDEHKNEYRVIVSRMSF